jgi:hypothetical protein
MGAAGAMSASEQEHGGPDGPDDEGGEEFEAASEGFEVPEPVETRDEIDAPSTLDDNKVPEPPAGSSDDDLQ